MKEIVQTVAEYFRMPKESLMLKSRKTEIVRPRMLAMYFGDKTFSTSDVARYFKMEHASVIHAKKVINQELGYDKKLRQDIDSLSHILGIYPEGKTRFLIDLGREGTTVKKQLLMDFCKENEITIK